jgi:hypothetical protein
MLKTMIACFCRTRPRWTEPIKSTRIPHGCYKSEQSHKGSGDFSRAPLGTPPPPLRERPLTIQNWSLRVVFIASSARRSKDCHLGQSRLRILSSKVTSEVASTSFRCDERLFVPDAVIIPGSFQVRSASCRMRLLTPRHKKRIPVPPMAFEESSSSNGRAGL